MCFSIKKCPYVPAIITGLVAILGWVVLITIIVWYSNDQLNSYMTCPYRIDPELKFAGFGQGGMVDWKAYGHIYWTYNGIEYGDPQRNIGNRLASEELVGKEFSIALKNSFTEKVDNINMMYKLKNCTNDEHDSNWINYYCFFDILNPTECIDKSSYWWQIYHRDFTSNVFILCVINITMICVFIACINVAKTYKKITTRNESCEGSDSDSSKDQYKSISDSPQSPNKSKSINDLPPPGQYTITDIA